MSAERNKAAVRRYVDDVPNEGNLAVLDEVIDVNISYREPRLLLDLADGRSGIQSNLTRRLTHVHRKRRQRREAR